jgi:integrase
MGGCTPKGRETRRRLAGIACAHKLAREENPTAAEEVKVVLAGIRRTVGCVPRRKAAATADRIRAMLEACDTRTILGIRDRALLALGFAGVFRRSELVALRVEELGSMPRPVFPPATLPGHPSPPLVPQ